MVLIRMGTRGRGCTADRSQGGDADYRHSGRGLTSHGTRITRISICHGTQITRISIWPRDADYADCLLATGRGSRGFLFATGRRSRGFLFRHGMRSAFWPRHADLADFFSARDADHADFYFATGRGLCGVPFGHGTPISRISCRHGTQITRISIWPRATDDPRVVRERTSPVPCCRCIPRRDRSGEIDPARSIHVNPWRESVAGDGGRRPRRSPAH
jgi:hypothetical protein